MEITLDDLENASRQNTRNVYSIRSLQNVMEALCEASLSPPETEDAIPMLVLTNKSSFYGAAAILDPEIQRQLSERFKTAHIIFSSVHEALAVPSSAASPDDLVSMVRQINGDESIIKHEDILSDHIFSLVSGRLVVSA
jgi:hypothetical protein